jgi:hypothetical protein
VRGARLEKEGVVLGNDCNLVGSLRLEKVTEDVGREPGNEVGRLGQVREGVIISAEYWWRSFAIHDASVAIVLRSGEQRQ